MWTIIDQNKNICISYRTLKCVFRKQRSNIMTKVGNISNPDMGGLLVKSYVQL